MASITHIPKQYQILGISDTGVSTEPLVPLTYESLVHETKQLRLSVLLSQNTAVLKFTSVYVATDIFSCNNLKNDIAEMHSLSAGGSFHCSKILETDSQGFEDP